jgi:hypothetical protein
MIRNHIAFMHFRQGYPYRFRRCGGWKCVALQNDAKNSGLILLFNLLYALNISILLADLLLLNRAINPVS